MKTTWSRAVAVVWMVLLVVVALSVVEAANPPMCPHSIWWNNNIANWVQGAPWVKVIFRDDIVRARSAGAANVFYRPYDVPGTDDGICYDGAAMATHVLNLLSTVPQNQWPEAIGYRNEFTDTSPTPQQFIPYYDTLRAGGYTGMIIFGSYSVGWPGQTDWALPQIVAAVNKADGIQTHEYFDLTVGFWDTWLCRRHVRAINEYPYLLGKPWFIGEFGSGPAWCPMEDSQCRRGWRDGGKMTAQQYIDQMAIYRAGVADQVVAVFVFADGDSNWWDFEVCDTPVGDWMETTWTPSTGVLTGNVKNSSSQNLSAASVTLSPGGANTLTDANGNYTISNLAAGSYTATAAKSGYNNSSHSVSITAGQTTTRNFTLTPVSSTGTMNGFVVNLSGSGISGATVTANPGGYTTTSSPYGGIYDFSNVPAGTYSITASKPNFVTTTVTGVVVTGGQNTLTNIYMPNSMNTGTPTGTNLARQAAQWQTDSNYSSNFDGSKAIDGVISSSSKWTSTATSSTHWLALDLGSEKTVNGFIVRHASAGGEETYYNTQAFKIQSASSMSGPWVDEVTIDNTAQAGVTTRTYDLQRTLRYVRLYITDAGIDNYARIPEFEVWGATSTIASEAYYTIPNWTSSFDAGWGSAASLNCVTGGHSEYFMQASRTSQGSSSRVSVYTVSQNTNITISIYMKCPSYANPYWMESAYKLGSNTAQNFDADPNSWTMIKKFSNTGTNGNNNIWTQYSVSLNTGSNTQISIGYKHGASGCTGPTVGWDTFVIQQ